MVYRDKTYKAYDKKHFAREVAKFFKAQEKVDAVAICLLCLAVAAIFAGLCIFWRNQDVKNYQRNKTIVADRLASNYAHGNAGEGFGVK